MDLAYSLVEWTAATTVLSASSSLVLGRASVTTRWGVPSPLLPLLPLLPLSDCALGCSASGLSAQNRSAALLPLVLLLPLIGGCAGDVGAAVTGAGADTLAPG